MSPTSNEQPPHDAEGGGTSSGVPAVGALDGGSDTTGRAGLQHWRESTITQPGLDDRGNVFFAAIEMTRMPMVLSDPNQPDNPIVFANKAFLDLTGYEEAEILGRNCRFLQGAETDRETVREIRDALAAYQSIAVEMFNYRRDGSGFWNAVFIGPVYDTGGKLLYFFASQLDVTRRRRSEQAYRQAQKMESIGQLTAGLAHDFNNLLQVVNGNLELLALRVQDERLARYVEKARSAAERGAKLTRQLLAFARKTRLEPRPIDLAEVVGGFADMIESAVGHQVTLKLDLAPDLPPALIDPDQLEMALLNIVTNARDAAPGGTVTIATRRRTGQTDDAAADADEVVLEVRDDGQGMPAEVAERATEPFFTTKGVGKGTGLGLAMASGFVRQSRGRLEIDSVFGEGTAVRLIFPALHARDHPVPAESIPAAQQARTIGGGRAEHVLVVEDSSEVLELATEILEAAGYRVTTAASGEDGLRAFDRMAADDRIDLLFTDLVMPGGMNGLALADAIIARDATVSVLLTTGYNEELVGDPTRSRAADVLSKPYRQADLLDRARHALNRRGAGGERRKASEYGVAEA